MVYRSSWLAGLAALAFAFVNLNALIKPSEEGIAWQFAALAALILGVVITWTTVTYRIRTWLVILINAAALFIAIARVTVPETTRYLLPSTDTLGALDGELEAALSVIRTGVEPVAPIAGIVAIIMVVLWVAGGLLSWGLLKGHPYVALIPPLVLSLQFTTMDRRPTAVTTIAAFIALTAMAAFAISADNRDQGAGRMAPRGQWAPKRYRPSVGATALLAVTIAAPLALVGFTRDLVPSDGVLDWRVDSPSISAALYGSDSNSYNPFIGIHQQLVSNGETIRFWAGVASDVPADQVYFQLMTMERYDGEKFSAGRMEDLRDADSDQWQDAGHAFAGPTEVLASNVVIDQLEMPWLPVPATPFAVAGEVAPYLQVRPEDGSVVFDGGVTSEGMAYRVDANVSRPDLDVLATVPGTTRLSIAFAQAAERGQAGTLSPVSEAAPVRVTPPDPERFLELPDDQPTARITELTLLAREWTEGLETPWERGLAIEAQLRRFRYTTDITPDQAATDLAEWLLNPASPNYRAGYCENFSTAMAVLARTLGIHSRVVLGFTPGEAVPGQPGVVVVRDKHAHAWVELWMPNQGWVRFDPTPRPDRVNPSTTGDLESDLEIDVASLLDIELPEPEPLDPSNAGTNDPFEDFRDIPFGELFGTEITTPAPESRTPGWVSWLVVAVAALALLAVLQPLARRMGRHRRLRRLHEGDIAAAWEDIVLRLGDLGRPVDETHTPAEVAASVYRTMEPLAATYERALYGPDNGEPLEREIRSAETSLHATHDYLLQTSTRQELLMANYRPRTNWLRRLRRRD